MLGVASLRPKGRRLCKGLLVEVAAVPGGASAAEASSTRALDRQAVCRQPHPEASRQALDRVLGLFLALKRRRRPTSARLPLHRQPSAMSETGQLAIGALVARPR